MSGVAQFVTYGSNRIQNFWRTGQTFQGQSYTFVPFLFRGATAELGGDNSEAFLAFATNSMMISLVGNRSVLNSTVTVASVWITQSLAVASSPPPRIETYVINAIAFNEDRIEVRLRSPVDAANTRFPNKRLTSGLVGNLPRDGQVRIA